MKKFIITGIAALITAASMTGCGLTDAFRETNTTETGATSAVAEAAPAETAAAVPVAPDTAAETTAAAGSETSGDNEFLNNLNKQMEYFNNPGTATAESNTGVPETTDVTAAAEPAVPVETTTSAAADDGLVGMRVGDAEHGFITVPKSWVPFHSVYDTNNEMIAYCDGTENNIITMRRYPMMVAQQVADKLYDFFETEEGAEITGSRSCEIEGREAYRIDVEYKAENKTVYAWTVQGDDGYTYYLCIEFTDPDVFALAPTYSIKA